MTVQNSFWATIFPGLLQKIVEEAGDDTAARCAGVCKDWFAALSPTLPDDRRTRASQAGLQQLAKVTDYKALIPAFWFLDAESQRKLLFEAYENGHLELVRKLLASSAIDLTTKDAEGNTLLHLAVGSRYVEMVRVLLEGGKADPNAQDNNGRILLHDAASAGNVQIAELFLADDRVNPDVLDNDGQSPLYYAVWDGRYNMVRLLLADNRVQPNRVDNEGKRPVDWAADTGWYGLVPIFLQNGTDPSSLSGAGRMEPAWTRMLLWAAMTVLEQDSEAMEPHSGDEGEIDSTFCGATAGPAEAAEPAEANEVGPLAEGVWSKALQSLARLEGCPIPLELRWLLSQHGMGCINCGNTGKCRALHSLGKEAFLGLVFLSLMGYPVARTGSCRWSLF